MRQIQDALIKTIICLWYFDNINFKVLCNVFPSSSRLNHFPFSCDKVLLFAKQSHIRLYTVEAKDFLGFGIIPTRQIFLEFDNPDQE